jgi:hypothetical protein
MNASGISLAIGLALGATSRPSRLYGALDGLVPQHVKEFCDPSTFVKVGEAHEQTLEHFRERSIDLLGLGIRKTSAG